MQWVRFQYRYGVAISLGLLLMCGLPKFVMAEPVPTIDVEYWLDRAAQACQAGDQATLDTVSDQLRGLMNEPPVLEVSLQRYIQQWLVLFQHGVCLPEQLQQRTSTPDEAVEGQITLSTSIGYLDNVNLGTRHENLSINNPFGDGKVNLQVDERSRPLSSSFVNVRGTYQVMNAHGGTDYAAALQQVYPDEPDYNMTGLAAGRQWQADESAKEAHFSLVSDPDGNTRASLGGVYHQVLSVENTDVVRNTRASLGARYDVYPQQAEQNAVFVDAGIKRQQLLPEGGQLSTGIVFNYDHALGSRPGGSRVGLDLSGSWNGESMAGWSPSLGATLSYKRDDDAYNRALFSEGVRNQTQARLELGLSKKITNSNRIAVKYTLDKSQDREIPLFDLPLGNTLGITFEHQLDQ